MDVIQPYHPAMGRPAALRAEATLEKLASRWVDAEGVHGWWTPLARERRHLGGCEGDRHATNMSRVSEHSGIEWTFVRHTQYRGWCYSCRREMTDTLLQLRDRGQPCCILSLSLSFSSLHPLRVQKIYFVCWWTTCTDGRASEECG